MILSPFEICLYSKLCPTSKNCWGTRSDREGGFQCDFIVIMGINLEFWVPKCCYDK